MKIFRYGELLTAPRGGVFAIGFFDGVHSAHRRLLSEALKEARGSGAPFGIITFSSESEIKKASPFTFTMVSALTQGEVGYVGLPKNYGIGGYETAPDRYKADPCVGEAFIKYGIEILNK